MNTQEIIDKVTERLRDGTGRAADDLGNCMYLTEHNTRCAVGYLLPAGNLIENIKGSIRDIVAAQMDGDKDWGLEDWVLENVDLLEDLQFTHDFLRHWDDKKLNGDGEKYLRTVAERHNLKYLEVV